MRVSKQLFGSYAVHLVVAALLMQLCEKVVFKQSFFVLPPMSIPPASERRVSLVGAGNVVDNGVENEKKNVYIFINIVQFICASLRCGNSVPFNFSLLICIYVALVNAAACTVDSFLLLVIAERAHTHTQTDWRCA